MKTMNQALALAAVAILAVACGEDAKPATTAAADTTAAKDTVAGDATAADGAVAVAGDATADTAKADGVAPAGDVSAAAAEPGCTSAADKTYLATFADPAAAAKFGDSNKKCTLGGCYPGNGDEKVGAKCIGDCIIKDGHGLSGNCAACYGGFSYCSAKNCIASCAAAPTGADCKKCQEEKGCTKTKDDCTAGK